MPTSSPRENAVAPGVTVRPSSVLGLKESERYTPLRRDRSPTSCACGLLSRLGRYDGPHAKREMTMTRPAPKYIKELTISDLERNRWCVYHNNEEGYDSFEFAIPDTHLGFSEHAIEIELSHFAFPDGRIMKGSFDGSASFSIFHDDNWHPLWFGASKPNENTINEFKCFLTINHLTLPEHATAIWSGTSKIFSGLQYLDDTGAIREIVF